MLFALWRSFYELVLTQKLIYGQLVVWFIWRFIVNGLQYSTFRFQTFELLTGHWLFHPKGCEELRREDDHLAKMMEITGETFDAKLLERSRLRNVYFDESG
jgi:hypothetical protein